MREQSPAMLPQIDPEAESPTNARYQIKLLRLQGGFAVEKLSGPKGHLGDKRARFFRDRSEAEKAVEKIIRVKTSPGRKGSIECSQ